MLQTIRNAWKLPDIRKKLVYVLFILLLYRIGTVIPVPFVNASTFDSYFGNTIFSYMDTLSGGALSSATLFALGISPYITASIVMQLLTVAIPALERMAKDGENGKKKINSLTRYVTVILAVVTAIGYYMLLSNSGLLDAKARIGGSSMWALYAAAIIICFCAGAALIMWLAEKINENGIGNGISLILFANIIAGAPSFVYRLYQLVRVAIANGEAGMIVVAALFVLLLLLIILAFTVFVIFVTGSERRIPIQYAKRTVGRKMYGGQSSNLPIKLNMAGVMPVIFASSIVSLPATIMAIFFGMGEGNFWYWFFSPNGWLYPLLLFVLIIAFSYFYIAISFNPVEVANNLKSQSGTILGIRPGRPTSAYISKILNKITFIGAIFLSIIAVLPIIANPLVLTPVITGVVGSANSSLVATFASSFTFGGTSLLIVVGVALETVRELEAQLAMRNYKGFLG